MHVDRIRVEAFGRLHDIDTGSAPLGDLVVVLGPNEGGKSTLFQFLATILYGFYPASREAHPYTPWGGGEAAGIADLRLADGDRLEVHRRLLATPTGMLVRGDATEDLRNRTLPCAEHVPLAVFRQVYAISLSELAGLTGESWARIQDRLIAGLGAVDLRPARIVADELEAEAAELWRPHRRGNQKLRQLRERLRELDVRRRHVADADRVLRDKVREREREQAELERARAERESFEVYVERFRALVPVRTALLRARALEDEAGAAEDLAGLPDNPGARLAELDARAAEQGARLAELTKDAESPKRRSEGLRPGDDKLLARRAEVERVTARVQAAGWMRSRAGQLEQELRELAGRVETEAAELFDVPWERVDAERVRALPTAPLRARARELEDTRFHAAAQRDAARRATEEAARLAVARDSGPSWGGALAVAVVGAILLAAGVATERGPLSLLGALVLGAGAMLLGAVLRRARGAPAPPPPPDRGPAQELEAQARRALAELLGELPVREALLDTAPAQLAGAVERIQLLLRDRRDRADEMTRLRTDTATLADELTGLAAACETELPADPVAAAHVLASAAVEAGRRQAAAERAREELARLERMRAREEEGLAGLRADAARLRARVTALGGGDEKEGLSRCRARREAAAHAARIVADLERAHPDLKDTRARIRQAEEAGEDWVVDEEALARRRVRLPELTQMVESLTRKEAALARDIEHLAEGETLDRIDGEAAVLQEQVQRLERERDRRHVLARLLREADRRFREEHQPELVRRAGEHLATITGGRYSRVLLADGAGDLSFRVRSEDAPRPVPVEAPLSTGTREQVYLALRLAAVDQLDRGGERLPLFLDETLVNWDPERRHRGLELLAQVARDRQVFVFTAQPDTAARLAAHGARVVTMDAPR